MTDTQTPERIWVVYAEGSESRDELPEVFAALEERDQLKAQYGELVRTAVGELLPLPAMPNRETDQ